MTVGELFKELSWEAVKKAIVTLYPDERPALPAYQKVFIQVCEKEPSVDESGMTVHVKFIPESDFSGAHYSVDGKIPDDHYSYALDFSTFSQWSTYPLSEETLSSLHPEEIAAHVLYEMTFHGFSDDVIQQKIRELEEAVKEVEEGKAELIPLEEVLKKLALENDEKN